MTKPNTVSGDGEFAANLVSARQLRGITQSQLARLSGVNRLAIVRAESGKRLPDADEIMRLAVALRMPLGRLMTGRWRPLRGIRGIAFELWWLGVRDLEVPAASIPGAFRRVEEILVLAVQGNRPESRVIEAIPYVLSRREFDPFLLSAFARNIDPRTRRRLAWLGDIALTLMEGSALPTGGGTRRSLEKLLTLVKRPGPTTPQDSLGYPSDQRLPIIWRRWRISHASQLREFERRAAELTSLSGGDE